MIGSLAEGAFRVRSKRGPGMDRATSRGRDHNATVINNNCGSAKIAHKIDTLRKQCRDFCFFLQHMMRLSQESSKIANIYLRWGDM